MTTRLMMLPLQVTVMLNNNAGINVNQILLAPIGALKNIIQRLIEVAHYTIILKVYAYLN